MVSSWQCSDKVITVGNYSGGHIYSDVDGISRNPLLGAGEVRQNLFPSSSWGPTRDGRQKPNITATGSTTIATGDSLNIALLLTAPANRLKVGIGGKHNRNGGTSMASPIVTGVVALYLEKHPTASYNEVMQAIQQTAKTDAFTGAVPNVKWGYGKIDAFKMLTVPVYTAVKIRHRATITLLQQLIQGVVLIIIYGMERNQTTGMNH
jgi:subtilisin family serine protease